MPLRDLLSALLAMSTLALFFFVAFVLIGVFFAGYHRIRVKGYRPPAAGGLLVAVGTVGIGLAAVGAHAASPRTSPSLIFFEMLWIPLLVSAIGMTIVILVLPQRPRVFGERRVLFPFVWIGRVLIGAGLVFPVFAVALWLRGRESGWFVLEYVVVALTLGVFFRPTADFLTRRWRETKSVPVLGEVLAKDPRSPVLYLRAFAQESQFFVIGPKSDYGAYAKSWHATVATEEQAIGLTFEEYLGDAFVAQIGPFIALGSPQDYLSPEGALRTYADDAHWESLFLRFAREAACIVAEVGKSSNLHWEFTRIRQEGLHQKLFIFTRLSHRGYAHQWAFWNLLWRLKGLHSANWQEFSREFTRLGYEMDSRDPGSGSILTFDSDGRCVSIKTEARRPLDFVEPIALRIANLPSAVSCCGESAPDVG